MAADSTQLVVAAQAMADAIGAHDNQNMPWSLVRDARERLLTALKFVQSETHLATTNAAPQATPEAAENPSGACAGLGSPAAAAPTWPSFETARRDYTFRELWLLGNAMALRGKK